MTRILLNSAAEKICNLLFSLTRSEGRMEMVADEVEDSNLRTALTGLAAESSLFAEEITTQLKTHGIALEKPVYNFEDCFGVLDTAPFDRKPGAEILHLCEELEACLTRSYRAVLAEISVPVPLFRELLQLQFNSLKNSLLRIRLINRARFAH
mgnify:FL=1